MSIIRDRLIKRGKEMTETKITISGKFYGVEGFLFYTNDNDFISSEGTDGTQFMVFDSVEHAEKECQDIMRNGDLEFLKTLFVDETTDFFEEIDGEMEFTESKQEVVNSFNI
jgi:hypothetical protein